MPIFIDTSDIQTVDHFLKMGIIRGVTTNPTILLKDGFRGDTNQLKTHIIQLAERIHPYPLSVEVTTNDPSEMETQAVAFASWAPNINVKIAIHGPTGDPSNLPVIHRLEEHHDIRVNATALMNAQQCLAAAMAGATYVSIFGGRVNNM